ncbi:MAG: putative quinol monooxygenase [Thermomicrobiales bacterium]
MIVLTAIYHGQAGKGDEIEAALKRMAPLVAEQEPGCAMYQVSRSHDDADRFLLYELYADQAAIDAHRATPHFKEIIEGTIIPMLEKRDRAFYDLVIE